MSLFKFLTQGDPHMSKKLEKVLEYLINNQEDKAKELLHQVFIEKARSIHEELINMDEESLDNLDMGADLEADVEDSSDELKKLEAEIEAEETMAEAEDDDMDVADAEMDLDDELSADDDMADMGDDMGSDEDEMDMDVDMDVDSGDMDTEVDVDMDMEEPEMDADMDSIESTMEKLEDALAELKAEFEAIEAGKSNESSDEDEGEEAEGEEEADDEESEEEMDESWLNEFDDLEESVDLEKVSAPTGDEVGSGKFAKPDSSSKSPVGKAPTELMGAKPVAVKSSNASGYNREAAPSSQEMKGTANRRKKATDGMKEVSKEGDNAAMLNKKIGAEGTKSPLSSSPRK